MGIARLPLANFLHRGRRRTCSRRCSPCRRLSAPVRAEPALNPPYRPGALCQFDLWQPSREIPVGAGQTRRGYVVVGCLPYSRVGAGTLVFSKEAPDLLYGIGECLAKLSALPETLVWDREGALHAGGGRPSDPFAAFCGELGVGWRFLEPRDPQSKGVVERLQATWRRASSPAARSPMSSTARSSSTAGSQSAPTSASTARFAVGRRIDWPRS
ncbi:MAG: DDE-type integrase/transposase/recombinase [Actinobacteria bacterium]|nr:DDE-type integrase/transposase/recombinase [Actinomycetota bacterium]